MEKRGNNYRGQKFSSVKTSVGQRKDCNSSQSNYSSSESSSLNRSGSSSKSSSSSSSVSDGSSKSSYSSISSRHHHRRRRSSSRDRRRHSRSSSQETLTTLEITNLTKRVSEKHLDYIFSHYLKRDRSLGKVEKHRTDFSRALVSFKSR